MKTDSIFYNLFKAFPGIFFELIGISPEEASAYEFTSREVKQLSFRLDGLFLPTDNNPDKPLYVLEVQFQPDDNLYYRLFGELFLYLRQYKPPYPWQVVIIYPSRRVEREQTLHFGEMLTLKGIRRIYLDELGESAAGSLGVGVVKLVIEDASTAPALAKRLIAQAKEEVTDEIIERELIDLIETIVIYKLPQKSREEIEAMFSLSELKQTKFYQEAFAEGEQIGEQRGEQRGQQRGQQAKSEAITRMLEFGLQEEAIAHLLALPLNTVQQASQSFHSQNIVAFIELLKNQRLLFSPETLNELSQFIETFPDDIPSLSKGLTYWCKQEEHSRYLEAWHQVRKTQPSGYSPNKETLKNAIEQS